MKNLEIRSNRLKLSSSLKEFTENNVFQAVRDLVCLDTHQAQLVLAVENSRAQPGVDSYRCSINIPSKGVFLTKEHQSLYAAIEKTADTLRTILGEKARSKAKAKNRKFIRRMKRQHTQ